MPTDWGTFLLQALIGALLSSSIIAYLGGVLLQRRTEQISAQVRNQFEQELARFRSTMTWKEQSLAELLGPVYMQLDRTERAFARWDQPNPFLETRIIREGNQTIRDLLLARAHLVPPDLWPDAGLLVEHYDRWLEEYERLRGVQPHPEEPFVFVGPSGYPFPRESANRFQERFRETWEELYGGKQTNAVETRYRRYSSSPASLQTNAVSPGDQP